MSAPSAAPAAGAAPLRHRWLELSLLSLARTGMGVQFQSVGALGPLLLGVLAADYAELGSLIGAYSLVGVLVALPAGWLIARVGDRRALLGALALMAAGGLALALAPGFGVAMAGRLVAGGGASVLAIICAKRVLDRFQGREVAPAMGVMLAAWPAGIGLALLLLPLFGEAWRLGLLAAALLPALALPALWWAVPGAPRAAEAAGQGAPRMAPLQRGEWPGLLAVGVAWASYNACFAVALGFGPALLVARGAAPAEAGAVASLIGFAILPLLPLGGALGERFGRPLLVCAACILACIAALLAWVAGAPALLCLAAYGLISAPPAALIMAQLGRVLPPSSRPFGVGVYYTLFYAGMALMPPLAGWLRDATGAPEAPILAAAGFMAVALLALVPLGRR
ncbi:MFS transporter [Siccirubricoccus phaeus]|uniref:MFS transporter n=1 Tax=Siccirubricoccus phaeus TaxID=2595053 RepID=UPI0011F26A64|nr:MFS transporter [Siccirubricoccus phaeus]